MKKKSSSKKDDVEEVDQVEESTTETQEDSQESEVEVIEDTPEAAAPENEQLLRLAAEYDNFRKRTAKEKIALKDEALRSTALAFLPVYDNLDRALKQPCSDEAFKKGIEMTMTQLLGVMEKLELEKIPSVGELFDPNLHEALSRVDDDRWGENTIKDVFVEGFMYHDKVIRFAQVLVAN